MPANVKNWPAERLSVFRFLSASWFFFSQHDFVSGQVPGLEAVGREPPKVIMTPAIITVITDTRSVFFLMTAGF